MAMNEEVQVRSRITASPDAFAHHPELRGKITDPLTSFFRTFSVESLMQRFPQLEEHRNWVHTDAVREASRTQTLSRHCDGDLWIFGYGSLMWDPAFHFTDVRRASIAGYARRLILVDDKGARGTRDAPGLMAALDNGPGCEGLAFRIAAKDVDTETEILWRREMIAPGYVPTFVEAVIGGQSITTLTFVADHAALEIRPDISRKDQVRFIAGGSGFLGASKAYLENIVSHFALLGIVDEHCTDLLREVDDFLREPQ